MSVLPPYCELHCKTNYSFLTGASHADELVDQAIELDYSALAVTDENTLAGVVRAYSAAKEANKILVESGTTRQLKLIVGAEVIFNDAPPVVLWATDRASYAKLTRLLTVGRRRAPKGECWLRFDDLADHHQGLLAGVSPPIPGDRNRTAHIDPSHPSYPWYSDRQKQTTDLGAFYELFQDRAYLLAELCYGVDDQWRIEQLKKTSRQSNLPLVAAGDVMYHAPCRLPLHDVLTATKHNTTVAEAGDLLLPNAQRHLQSLMERQQAFATIPEAIERTQEIANRCNFCLSQLKYEYPEELAPDGQSPMLYLR
ncbi:MAG: PHP domain-containing protein [Planctomycetota bacterium]